MKQQQKEDVMLWQNWNHVFVRWKLNLEQYKPKHLTPTRHSKSLSAELRSSNSNRMKTKRTKMQCLNWPRNYKQKSKPTRNKLRKQKRLLLLTSLNTERHNKNWKKPKTVLRWPKLIFPQLTNTNYDANEYIMDLVNKQKIYPKLIVPLN